MTTSIIASALLLLTFALGWLLGAISMWAHKRREETRRQARRPSPHREPPERSKQPPEYQHIDWDKLSKERMR